MLVSVKRARQNRRILIEYAGEIVRLNCAELNVGVLTVMGILAKKE
jgi:hypothetical protein